MSKTVKSNLSISNNIWMRDMVGKSIRLSGILVNAKGNYSLQTTNGIVELGSGLSFNENDDKSNVLVEGVLELRKAIKVSGDFDSTSIQSNFRPGQYIPEHYFLREARIVKP